MCNSQWYTVFTKGLIVFITLLLLFGLPVFTVQSDTLEYHPITFYLNSNFVTDAESVQPLLQVYVDDINHILEKNTIRRLILKDVIIVDSKPHTDYMLGEFPETNYEIWAYVEKSTMNYSHSGYMGYDLSGAGVCGGMKWTQIYNPLVGDAEDYWRQISAILHEMAHIWGAGIGEYYNLCTIKDTTQAPFLDINCLDSQDSFWSDKQDFMVDPLLKIPYTPTPTREFYLETVKYSNLTAKVINGHYRNGLPVGGNIIIYSPVPIKIKVWNIIQVPPYKAELLYEGNNTTIPWGELPRSNFTNLKLIKVFIGEQVIIKYVSVFDMDIHNGEYIINISFKQFLPVIGK